LGAFGEKLRKQREQRGMTLDAISNTTKISTRMLRALEDEHFDQLPGGVFNKGFVRAYARQVGLNEEEAITDYLAALREGQVQSQNILPDFRTPAHSPLEAAAPEAPRDNDLRGPALRGNDLSQVPSGNRGSHDRGNDDRSNQILLADRRKQSRRDQDRRDQNRHNENPADRTEVPRHVNHSALPSFATGTHDEVQSDPVEKPPARIPWGKLAAALLVLSAALAFWNFRRQNQITAASAPSTSNQSAAPVAAPPSAASKPSSAGGSLKVPPAPPAATLPVGTSSAVTTSPVKTRASMPSPAAAMPAPPRAATTTAASTPGAAANPPTPNAAARTSAAKPLTTFVLLIRAEKTTWVSIVADGKPVAEETLIAPAHTSVRATREIVVKAGNAAGISFLFNGKEIPAQGNDGEVKTYVFDATTGGVVP
jgi:cytoskeletal protein RodZ